MPNRLSMTSTEAFFDAHRACTALLAELQAKLLENAQTTTAPNWGDVGSAARIERLLRDALGEEIG